MVGPPGFEPGTSPQVGGEISHLTGYERRRDVSVALTFSGLYLGVRGQTELRAHLTSEKYRSMRGDLNVL